MIRAVRDGARAVGHLPGNEQPALPADMHAYHTIIEARDQPAHALRKGHWLRLTHLGLAVGSQLRLAILAHDGLLVVGRGVEDNAVNGADTGVVHVP